MESTVVQVVASGPDVAGDPLYESLLALIFSAEDRIWIVTPYFVPDEMLARALTLATRRGVDVRLIVPARSNHYPPTLPERAISATCSMPVRRCCCIRRSCSTRK